MTNDNGQENMNFRSIRKKKACAKNQPMCIFCAVLCCLAKGAFRSLETFSETMMEACRVQKQF